MVSVYDHKKSQSHYACTKKGAEYATILCTVIQDQFPNLDKIFVKVNPTKMIPKLISENYISTYYTKNGEEQSITEYGYNMLWVMNWLLDEKLQKKYRQKIAISNGLQKGMETTIKIMQGVVKFGQSMTPPPKKKTPVRKTTRKPRKRNTQNKRKHNKDIQWERDLKKLYEL